MLTLAVFMIAAMIPQSTYNWCGRTVKHFILGLINDFLVLFEPLYWIIAPGSAILSFTFGIALGIFIIGNTNEFLLQFIVFCWTVIGSVAFGAFVYTVVLAVFGKLKVRKVDDFVLEFFGNDSRLVKIFNKKWGDSSS